MALAPVVPAQVAQAPADMEILAAEDAGATQTLADPAKAQALAEVSTQEAGTSGRT